MKLDSKGNPCPFCIENGQVNILSETEKAYLTQVMKPVGGAWKAQMGRYLVIPKLHMETIMDRPDDWTKYEKTLLHQAHLHASNDERLMNLVADEELESRLNTTWNNGPESGRRVPHSHMWVIYRYDDLGIGTDALISEVQRLERMLAVAYERIPVEGPKPPPVHEGFESQD